MVIFSLIILGLAEGSLLTLLFNVMVTSSPKEMAGDVGALRGVANNLSTALGTAFASLVAISLLAMFVTTSLNQSAIPDSLQSQVNLDTIDFISNDQLDDVLAETTATPEQVTTAVAINEAARLKALRASFLILAGFSLLAIIPALGLPDYNPDDSASSPSAATKRSNRPKKPKPTR